jgi:hypothetical protein
METVILSPTHVYPFLFHYYGIRRRFSTAEQISLAGLEQRAHEFFTIPADHGISLAYEDEGSRALIQLVDGYDVAEVFRIFRHSSQVITIDVSFGRPVPSACVLL